MRAALLAATALCWGAGTARAQGQAVQLNPNRIFSGGPNGLSQLDGAGRVPSIDVVNPMDAKWGAKGDGVTDDTSAINAAAVAAGVAYVATGVAQTLELRGHNFAVAGVGTNPFTGASDPYTGLLLPSGVKLHCDDASITAIGANQQNLALVQNAHGPDYYSASVPQTRLDHDIDVDGCVFNYPNWDGTGAGKAAQFTFASNISFRNNVTHGGADLVGMVGVTNDDVSGNFAFGVTNAAYDAWFGGGHHRWVNNYAEVRPPTVANGGNAQGIQANGSNTDGSQVVPMDDVLVANNTVVFDSGTQNLAGDFGGCMAFHGSQGGGALTHFKVVDNHCGFAGPISPLATFGVLFGVSPGIILQGNTIDGMTNGPSIIEDPARDPGYFYNAIVKDNTLSNCGPGTGNANIQLVGYGSTITGNRQLWQSCKGPLYSSPGNQDTVSGNDDGTGPDGSSSTAGVATALSSAATEMTAQNSSAVSMNATALGPMPGGVVGVTVTGGGLFYVPPILTVSAPPTAGRVARLKPGPFGLSNPNGAALTPGSGYTVGEGLFVVGGVLSPGGSPAEVEVTAITNGVPTVIAYSSGSYSVLPPNPATFTSATGSGFSINLLWFTGGVQVIDPGSGYSPGSPPTITPTGCFSYGGLSCGTYTAIVSGSTLAISGLPLCANATTGQLCAVAAGAGQAVEVK